VGATENNNNKNKFILAGHLPIKEELLKVVYDYNPSIRSGSSKAHLRAHIQADKQATFQITFLRIHGSSAHANASES
jgi:hypothetical protein